MLLKIFKSIILFFCFFLLAAAVKVFIDYIFCPVYKFSQAKPFSGDKWYNPYRNLKHHWYKVNFHAHSKNSLSLTNGRNSAQEIYNYYHGLGYHIACISDYQHINSFIPPDQRKYDVYEHGWNIGKVHQIVVGAKKVLWLDYPIWQNRHHKQHIIDRLQKNSQMVILAHPTLDNGYTTGDIVYLQGYHAFEGLNHYRNSIKLWDMALSSGKVAWISGGDDSHNIRYPNETGARWTMIHAFSKNRKHILRALHKGLHYAVSGQNGLNAITVKKVQIRDNRLVIVCDSSAKKILFIGQGGKLKKTARNCIVTAYQLMEEDTYIWVEIFSTNCILYLNPIIRWDGLKFPDSDNLPPIDWPITWAQRIFFFLCIALLGVLISSNRNRTNIYILRRK